MQYILVVHNSDEVLDAFVSDRMNSLIQTLKTTDWWDEIIERLGLDDNAIPTLDEITSLYHDGDSECGFTLITK